MDTVRWEHIQDLFHRALERPPGERFAFLERECNGDSRLRDEVVAMVREDERAESVLDRPLGKVAQNVLGGGPLPSHAFGPYRVERFLGEGGMGVVFLARRADLDTVVALKVLRDAWLSPVRRDRFEVEQRTLARFDHPWIARLLDAGTLPDGTPWIAMEHVDGVSLTEYCDAHASSIDERLRLFRDVCEAVQHAHRHAIIHRDLKPSNILVRTDGTVKLLDFGIAKSLDAMQPTDERTQTLWRLITPAYAAPEQTTGQPVGTYTDVYALGVILHQLLTGRLPEGEPPSVVTRTIDAARRLGRSSWAELDVIVATATREDPERRYDSVAALIRDIDHFGAGEPLEARPESLSYRARKFVGRHRGALAAATLGLIAAVALVAVYGSRLATARNEAVDEAERAQRIQRFMLSLFEGGDDEAAPPDSLRVVTLLDRGVAQARTLDAEPGVQAELAATLGEIQAQLGRLDQADSLLASALALRRALHGADHPDVARSLVALGELRTGEARFDEADSLIREGLRMGRATLARDHPDNVAATIALGELLEGKGLYDEAIRVLEDAAQTRRATGRDDLELADALGELANAHFYTGNYAESDSLNREVLDIVRRRLGERHPAVADNLVNLGATQAQRGAHDEAERYYREALEITRAWYGDDHPKAATNRTMLGRALVAQQRYDEAEVELRGALDVLERVHGPTHPRVASALNELGIVALQRDHLDEAEAYYRRTVEIYRSVHGEEHDFLGVAMSNLASVSMARQDWAPAESQLREVVALFARTLSEEHVNTGIARIKHGRTLLKLGRFAEAQAETQAGFDVLTGKMDPEASWLRAARHDLQVASESLATAGRAGRDSL